MKRIIISLMVILMAFSLFISCEVNKTPEAPRTEAEGKDLNPETLVSVYSTTNDAMGPVVHEFDDFSKIKGDIQINFPNGLQLVTIEDYEKAEKDGLKPVESKPLVYKWLTIEAVSEKNSENGKIDSLVIKYSTLDNPSYGSDYETFDKSCALGQELNMFASYHLNDSELSFSEIIGYICSMCKPSVKIIGALNIYLDESETPSIVFIFDNLSINVVNKKIEIKGGINTSKKKINDYSFNIDASIDFSDFKLVQVVKGEDAEILPEGNLHLNIKKLDLQVGTIKVNLSTKLDLTVKIDSEQTPFITACNIELKLREKIDGNEILSLDVALNANQNQIKSLSDLITYLKIYEFKINGEAYSAPSVKTTLNNLVTSEK